MLKQFMALLLIILLDTLKRIIPKSVMLSVSWRILHWIWNSLLDQKKQVGSLSWLVPWLELCEISLSLSKTHTLSPPHTHHAQAQITICRVKWPLSLFSCMASTKALEHMRKKIEMSTERIRVAKLNEEQARKVSPPNSFFHLVSLTPFPSLLWILISSSYMSTKNIYLLCPIYAASWKLFRLWLPRANMCRALCRKAKTYLETVVIACYW